MILLRFAAMLAVALVMMLGCRPATVSHEEPGDLDYSIVEADNGYRFTMAEFYERLAVSPLFPNGGIVEPEAMVAVLDSIVCDSMAGFAAADVRLEDHYEQHRLYRRRWYDKIIEEFFNKSVYSKVQIDSAAVVEFYWSRPDLFSFEEHVFLYDILISPRGLKIGPDSLKYELYTMDQMELEAEKLIRQIYSQIASLEDFQQMAVQYSHDTMTGSEGGLVGWAKRGIYLDPFDSVAFQLQPGDLSQPYRGRHGWHLLYCEDRVPEGIPPLTPEMYQAAVNNYYITQSNILGRSLLDSLFADIDLEYNEAMLDTNLFLVDEQQWVAIVSGRDTLDGKDAQAAEFEYRQTRQVSNTTPEMKKEMLKEAAGRLVLVQAARAIKIDTLPAVVAEEKSLRQKYSKYIVQRALKDIDWQPADSTIQNYYREHQDEFQPEKPLTVQHIIFEDSLFADFVQGQAMSGYEFLDLAEEHYPGEKEVRRELADLGQIDPEDVPEAFWKAAMRTPVGEVSHPVKTEYGYHIIKVLERREGKTFPQARPQIIQLFKKQHDEELFREFRDKLYKRYHVKFTGKLAPVHLEPLSLRG